MSSQKNSKSSVADLLKSVAKTTDDKKKSKVPIVDDPSFHTEIDEYITKNRDFKNAKVALELAETSVIEKGSAWYAEQKGVLNSVKYAGTEGAVLVTYKDVFSKVNDIAEDLKGKLKNKFDDYFQEKRTIKLKETSDDTIDFLLKALGEEKFIEIFEVSIDTVAVSEMDQKQFELPVAVREMLSQAKASLRVS
jgi:hypothetical protein